MTKKTTIFLVVLIVIGTILFFNRAGIESSLKVAPVFSESSYVCSGDTWLDAQFGDRQVTINLSDGRGFTLEQKMSASGSKYGNEGNAVVFWTKDNEAFVEEGGTQTYTRCISTSAEEPSLTDYFSEEMWRRGVANLGAMPIEGFDAELLKGAFPVLIDADFEGVLSMEGVYRLSGEKLEFSRTEGEAISTAERTISKEGMGILLANISKRLELSLRDTKGVDALIMLLSVKQQ